MSQRGTHCVFLILGGWRVDVTGRCDGDDVRSLKVSSAIFGLIFTGLVTVDDGDLLHIWKNI